MGKTSKSGKWTRSPIQFPMSVYSSLPAWRSVYLLISMDHKEFRVMSLVVYKLNTLSNPVINTQSFTWFPQKRGQFLMVAANSFIPFSAPSYKQTHATHISSLIPLHIFYNLIQAISVSSSSRTSFFWKGHICLHTFSPQWIVASGCLFWVARQLRYLRGWQ